MAFNSKQDLEKAIEHAFQSNCGWLPEATLEKTFYDDHAPCYVVSFGGLFTYTFLWSDPEFAFVIARSDKSLKAAHQVWKNIAWALTPGEKEDGLEVEFSDAKSEESREEDIDETLRMRIDLFITKANNTED